MSIRCPSASDCTSSSFIPCRGPTRRERTREPRPASRKSYPEIRGSHSSINGLAYGKILTGNHRYFPMKYGCFLGFPVIFPLSQSIDSGRMLKFGWGKMLIHCQPVHRDWDCHPNALILLWLGLIFMLTMICQTSHPPFLDNSTIMFDL